MKCPFGQNSIIMYECKNNILQEILKVEFLKRLFLNLWVLIKELKQFMINNLYNFKELVFIVFTRNPITKEL